jgi:hypothetical protein
MLWALWKSIYCDWMLSALCRDSGTPSVKYSPDPHPRVASKMIGKEDMKGLWDMDKCKP